MNNQKGQFQFEPLTGKLFSNLKLNVTILCLNSSILNFYQLKNFPWSFGG